MQCCINFSSQPLPIASRYLYLPIKILTVCHLFITELDERMIERIIDIIWKIKAVHYISIESNKFQILQLDFKNKPKCVRTVWHNEDKAHMVLRRRVYLILNVWLHIRHNVYELRTWKRTFITSDNIALTNKFEGKGMLDEGSKNNKIKNKLTT